jgi:hypothetical protein
MLMVAESQLLLFEVTFAMEVIGCCRMSSAAMEVYDCYGNSVVAWEILKINGQSLSLVTLECQ